MPKATRKLKKKEGGNELTKKSGDNGKCVEREQGTGGVEKKGKVCSKKGRELGELKRKEVSV